jgi:hypothetical protein
MRIIIIRLFVILITLIGGFSSSSYPATAIGSITELCSPIGIQEWSMDFEPDGIILTTFDRASMWVYDVARNARYPLPDTAPCGTNCNLSPDARWITYLNAESRAYGKMRLDGTERTLVADNATDVEWWTQDTLLVWTPAQGAYLQSENTEQEFLNVNRVVSIQPGGYWGLRIEQDGDEFIRVLVNTEILGLAQVAGQHIPLGTDIRYFNASSWSPTGEWLAFTAPHMYDPTAEATGAELFAIRPNDTEPTQWTDFNSILGAVRINGHAPGVLSWSPDGNKIAFWVVEMLGPSPEGNLGHAIIHILDINSGDITAYCGFATSEHTPNPPRLVWSPDSTHLVFGGNIPGDDKGYLLLALDTADGVFTALSEGVYPALGNPDVIAWGLPPR